jgi:penicillin amidase
MIPGLPFVAIGRNAQIAWGGTNLHAASSDLFDARSVEPQAMVQRTATLRVRGGRPRTVRWRDSPLGPVISDVPALHARGAPAALRWVGHTQSDELSAMLALNGATDWASFCAATARIAVPGQNWVYADRDGHVGLRRAAMLPRRPRDWPRNLLLSPDEIASWRTLADADELPSSFDPPDALIVSANEAPPDGAVPVGFLFSPDHRARRMRYLLAAAPRIGFEQLRRLQSDTMAVAARTTAHALAHELNARQAALRDALLAWDGRYDAASRGALAYELLVDALARLLHRNGGLIASRASWDVEALLRDDLAALSSHARAVLLDRAARIAARKLRRHRAWGDLHRLQPQHPLASLPVVGRAFRGPRWPADGSRETLHNSAHGFTSRPHVARFGSMARYIFDLGDLDRSWIVLLGGNDGWFGSAAAMDQVPAWRAGTLVQLPLTAEAAQSYPHVTRVRPA